MLDNLDGSLHRLYLGEQFILLPVPLFEEIIDGDLVREPRTMVVDVLYGFSLHWNDLVLSTYRKYGG